MPAGTVYGPIMRKKSSYGIFFLVRATAKTKIVLKQQLPNNDLWMCFQTVFAF